MGQYQHSGQNTGREQAAPKPFAFVPLSTRVNRNKPTGHDRYQKNRTTGSIHGTIEALSPIHIGSGVIDFGEHVAQQDPKLIKAAIRTKGNIVIPGSSLKGAIRSVVEAISESCVCKTVKKVRDKLPKSFWECNDKEYLCVACRMFGGLGFQSNIAIQDAPHIEEEGKIVTKYVPPLYRPKRYHPNEQGRPMRKFYKHGKVATGKTPFEACEVGSKFRFDVQVDNLSYAELGLFFTALGQHPKHQFNLKIGGAKPRCFGSVNFQIDDVHIYDKPKERYLDWDFNPETMKTGEDLKKWMGNCIDKATNSLLQVNQLQTLIDDIQPTNDGNCPDGVY